MPQDHIAADAAITMVPAVRLLASVPREIRSLPGRLPDGRGSGYPPQRMVITLAGRRHAYRSPLEVAYRRERP